MNCDAELKNLIRSHLAAFDHTVAGDDVSAAAVALTVVDAGHGPALSGLPQHQDWQHHAALILTKRSTKLRNHPGQWALPGGRIDPGETPEQTALRELHEEVGLALKPDAILGRLDDFITRSGFVMSPVVVWGGPDAHLVANEDEVESIHRIPISELLRADAPLLSHDEVAEGDAPVLRMPVGDSSIAAPTAALLYQFREVCVLGLATRVAHFEQPTFAWR